MNWTPLRLLRHRFAANVVALATRDPELAELLERFTPSQNYFIQTTNDQVTLGTGQVTDVKPLPQRVSPAIASDLCSKLFPHGAYTQPVLIAGEDMGWLLNNVYRLPCRDLVAPGHRPAIFFLIRDIERLWVILHIQDWQTLLADIRVRIFWGESAFEKFRATLNDIIMCPWPKMSLTIDPACWPTKLTLDQVINEAAAVKNQQLLAVHQKLQALYADATPEHLASLFQSQQPLKILGITSRYTTFLQYSMRDWLWAFKQLGHQTQLFIEAGDHEVPSTLAVANACAKFRPDLVVMIDHYRAEMSAIPENIPTVMWIQDRLPNIYCEKAGKLQTRLDYVIGYSRQECTQNFNYPVSRFMPAMVGVNAARFSPTVLTDAEKKRYGCDVSFVSTCTTPAEQIVREEIARQNSPVARRLLDDLFQRFKAIYDAGGSVTAGELIRNIIIKTMQDNQVTADTDGLTHLFIQRVNNSLFRHQAVRWVAEMGVDLRLYGKGWENHPEFARYARGVADNQKELPIIYQASAINLQVTPHGSVHQRLLDGLAAGGFFLLRSVAGDQLELILRDMGNWCREKNIRDGLEMVERCDESLLALTQRYAELGGIDPLANGHLFFGAIDEVAASEYTRTSNTLWKESDRVTFSTRQQLQSQVAHFLANPEERRDIASSMRQRVLETHTYEAISRRMLKFIAADLAQAPSALSLAA